MSRVNLIKLFGAEDAPTFNKCSSAYEMGRADEQATVLDNFQEWLKTQVVGIDNTSKEILVVVGDRWELAIQKYKEQGYGKY